MIQNRKIFTLLALAAFALTMVFLVLPNLLARALQNKLGNGLIINGSVHFTILPNFGIIANGVEIISETGKLRAAIKAPTTEIQIPFTALMLGTLKARKIILSQADIAITIVENGKTELQPETSQALTIEIKDSLLTFGSTKLESISAEIETAETGDTEINGVFFRDGQHGNFALNLASIHRLSEDGSPFDGAIAYGSNSLTLSGQLKFLNGLAFHGRGDISARDDTYRISGALAATDQTLEWPDADVAINGTNAKGSVEISSDTLNARLVTPALKVSNFDSLWSEAPFWELGRTGRLNLEIQDFSFRDLQLGKSSVAIMLDEKASLIELSSEGGIRGQIDLATASDRKTFDVKLSGQTTELAKLAPLVFSRGNMNFDLALRSEGKSPAEILSKLSGTAKIDLDDSEILGADMAEFVGDVSKEVITGWPNKTEKLLSVRSGRATFQINDGIATTHDITFAGSGYEVTGGGEIDVLRAAVDLKIDPTLITAEKTKLRLPVEIAIVGPWGMLQIQPDIEGVLTDPQAAFARLKLEGFVSGNQKRLPKKVPSLIKAN